MEGLLVLMAIVAVMAMIGVLAIEFGGETRETFVDPRRAPISQI
jgi:hypothetical protein